ncbi:MAG: hypothetical protein LBQ77_03650 [Treponema sp.]|nr:hypothetical protein [Treponema sp.]
MKIEVFTLADFAQESHGKLTIVGTFDTIMSRTFPCEHPQMSVVIRIRFDMWEFKNHTFRVEVRSLNGEIRNIESIGGHINVKGVGNSTTVSHLVFTISRLRFITVGMVNFILYINEKEVSSIPLYIRRG